MIDAREFVPGRMTGIGRMLAGVADALAECPWVGNVCLAGNRATLPRLLKDRGSISTVTLPQFFLGAERALSQLTRKGFDLFISPYPKLPFWGVHCPAVHTVHDVLDLSFSCYEKKFKTVVDRQRLKWALGKSALTWYDSQWSRRETEAQTGIAGQNPRVRHLALDQRFSEKASPEDGTVLKKHGLEKDYILLVGNGLPHKNLGLLLRIAKRLKRPLLFVGVPKANRPYWADLDNDPRTRWIETADDEDMPSLLREAFCLAQPSLAEGYGYPPLEAMACGTPAVVSNIEVLVETTGGNALTGGPHDGQSWIEAFERIGNEDVYQKQVEKGHQWIANLKGRNGWRDHVADIEELIGSHP